MLKISIIKLKNINFEKKQYDTTKKQRGKYKKP
jgi:hypothetical protein